MNGEAPTATTQGNKWLLFGSTGWLGGILTGLLREQGETCIAARSRLDDRPAILAELTEHRPKYVLNAAGLTGRPNVDWCEDHKQEVIRTNVVGTVNLADACFEKGVHMTNFASGCIYQYDDKHPIGGSGFVEEDEPNYDGSFYSKTKIMAEKLLVHYPNVLTLRLRMPVSDDLCARSFLTKISKYEKVVNVPNSLSILHDLLPISIDMTRKERKGVYNFTNPGAISHNQLLELYKKYISPSFEWKNFSLEEQAKILKAGRSNNTLDVSKLAREYPDLPTVQDSVHALFRRMQAQLGLPANE